MTDELAGATDLPVQIIGLNRSVYQGAVSSGSLAAMTGGRAMPWLRCLNPVTANDPSTTWRIPLAGGSDRAINNRELVIVDQKNRFLGSFDLTNGPINTEQPGGAERRAIVREFIRNAATIVDSEPDGLPDYWERDTFTDLSAVASTPRPESGGRTAFAEYALGAVAPVFSFEVPPGGGAPVRTLRFRQRLGLAAGLVYGISVSGEPLAWQAPGSGEVEIAPVRPIYDGSGMGEVVVRWLSPAGPGRQLFRVTADKP